MIKNIFYSIIYSSLVIYIYVFYLNPFFNYLGFEINRDIYPNLFLIIFFSVLPILFYKAFPKVSNVISVIIYVLLYVPTVATFGLAFKGPDLELLNVFIVFFASMVLLFYSSRLNFKHKKSKIKNQISIYHILIVTTLFVLYFVIRFSNTMNFVSWGEEMYELRNINSKLGTDLIARYLTGWLVYVFFPVLFVYGLIYKKYLFCYLTIIYTILMYMILASKLVLLLPLIILVFYKILNKINIISFFRFSIKYLIVLSILVLVIDYFFRNDNAIVYLASLLFLRTIGNGGLLNFWYYDFFANHPFTYFSHINFINFLGNGYPYGNDGLGKVVGTYYWASDMNANANFWATDGIASSGIYGVLIISIVLFVLLIIIDNITNLNENNFSILILLPFIASLTNTSLFSSLLTGGLFINIFIFYFLKIPRGSKS